MQISSAVLIAISLLLWIVSVCGNELEFDPILVVENDPGFKVVDGFEGDVVQNMQSIRSGDSHLDEPKVHHIKVQQHNPSQTQFNIRNNLDPPEPVNVYWYNVDTKQESLMKMLMPNEILYQTSYKNHVFVVRKLNGGYVKSVVVRFKEDNDELGPVATNVDIFNEKEGSFKETYLKHTGREWETIFPRPRPIHYMYEDSEIGSRITIESKHVHFRNSESSLVDEENSVEISATLISRRPRLFEVENFLSDEECDHIISVLKNGGLARSTTGEKDINPSRTSSTKWLEINETSIVENIIQRAFEFMKIPYSRENWKVVEKPQGLHYEVGQFYRAHHDHFDLLSSAGVHEVQKGRNRFATFFFYLNDVEEGGHTAFPQAKLPDSPDTYARNACNGEGGIRVAPKKGNAVMWYNMLEDGNGDKDALHEACPVLKGEKWGMNLWFWDPQRDDDGLH